MPTAIVLFAWQHKKFCNAIFAELWHEGSLDNSLNKKEKGRRNPAAWCLYGSDMRIALIRRPLFAADRARRNRGFPSPGGRRNRGPDAKSRRYVRRAAVN